jgi:hypothetical protein
LGSAGEDVRVNTQAGGHRGDDRSIYRIGSALV